jgi:ADP-heptose:LPS heptosyltransferase/GT2 family glycosyltransferase
MYAVPVAEAPESEHPVEPPAEMAVASAQATDKGTIAAGRRRARQRDQAATPVPEPERLPPQIQIDIDPAITAGLIHDRYDLLIRGRVVASTPIDEAALLLDGAVVGRVQYGLADHTAQTVLPDGTGATQYVFHLNLPLSHAQGHRICTCIVAARTQDGHSYEQPFDISVDPSGSVPISVAAGPTRSSSTYAYVKPPMMLYVERAALDDGGHLLVHGWAVSLRTMVTVQVFVDETRIGAAQLGGRRDDVGDAFPAYSNGRMSGFSLSTRLAATNEGMAAVRVQAISMNGFSQEVVLPVERLRTLALAVTPQAAFTVRTPTLPSQLATPIPATPSVPARPQDSRREIHLSCDQADLDAEGHLLVGGWAACATSIASVTVHLDGQTMGDAELGLPRDDVGDEYRHIPMARYSGFRFARQLGDVHAGLHRLRLVVRNGLGDVREEIRTVQIVRPEPAPAPHPAPLPQFRFEIDNPKVVAGAVIEPITGRLTIEGWVLARSGITAVDVMLDDQRLGEAHYGLARQDVGTAFPDWVDSLRSGYAFHCPPRSLRNGEHVVQLNVRARSGEVLEYRFRIEVRKSEDHEDGVGIRRRMTQVEADVADEVLDSLGHRPGFRLVLRQEAPLDVERILLTLGSLRNQVYRDWTLQVLAADADNGAAVRALLVDAAADLAERIDVFDPRDAEAFAQPIGDPRQSMALRLVGFLSPGDQLGCDALLETALSSGLHRDADFFYADEVRISPASREREPFFKPDFSPDLLFSTNYIGRPWFASTALLGKTGVTPRSLLESGEYDLVLRCTAQAEHIHHLPKLLCLRGTQQIDNTDMEAAALARAAARCGIDADVLAGAVPGTWRFRRTQPVSGMVSIIIPTCAARGYVETCVKTLRDRTAYRNFELICVDNIPDDQIAWKIWLKQNFDKIVPMPDAFNWSYFNNRGAAVAAGEYLLFLNDDIEVIQPDWLDAMLEHVQRPEVAVVGPRLLYPDSKVQHAGMFLAAPGIARHAFRFAASDEPGYFGLALTQRNVIAVTGACMLMRRTMYQALGGFDEAHEIINNDVDFCLRAHQAGKLVVFTPHASLTHHEAISRDGLPDVFDLSHFETRWKTLFASGDPYFSPRLTRNSDDYSPDDEPVQTVFAGHPLFRRDEIKRILVVKVDHIGDFITAFPAIRRLKQIFPAASLHVLASRAARAFAATLDCVDEFIEFEFFNPISGLGQREISREDYQALSEQLAPYRFDIAVDLRKHLDTRDVLRHTPARFLAGYDHMGQLPFLDIALEWEGDKNLQRKRSHVTDDLLNLVEAIGTAAAAERTRLDVAVSSEGPPAFLDDDARALFAKPVVAVHPGVGNAMRQWPAEHFASLIDLLVEKNAVNAVLIGGPEEAELAAQVLEQVVHRGSVVSLVGKTPLRELPALLSACALYVGNNSGPKHIAAALGVPTIGIHSGVVDAIEWGPIGKRAVALRRNMTCSPCYFSRQEDCPRNFACMRGLEPTLVQEVSEIFLARPVERRSVLPFVELRPVVVAAPTPKAQSKGRGQRKAMPTPREKAAPNEAPKVEKSAVRKPKAGRKRGGHGSPVRRR